MALFAGCTEGPVEPAERAIDRSTAVLFLETRGDPQRLRLDLAGWGDFRTVIPLAVPIPAPAEDIGTGSPLLITIPDEGRFGCTANFVWASGGRRYLGAAGHCFLPADRAATHGAGADYDASGVIVEVCVDGCGGNFDTNQLTGTWLRLGRVVYARQTLDSVDVGNDFGVVEIPRQLGQLIRLSMPVWGGPTGVQTLELGDYACHYGNGLLVGETFLTKARIGIGGGSDEDSWMGDFAGAFGDSGSGVVGCVNNGLASFRGTGAIGVLTHLGVGLDETSGEHGVTFGTTLARAVEMGREAGLNLSIVLP
jgi:hypothetical protein